MYVDVHPRYRDTASAKTAQDILSACVHCGFCLATCPTYLDSRDERDSPRGRIYLIKQLLETGHATKQTRTHLDRCLTCRSCETTCPSGVAYGQLIDIGRELVVEAAPRAPLVRGLRALLAKLLSSPYLFRALLGVGQFFRPLVPKQLRRKIPPPSTRSTNPEQQHRRKMLVLTGCVQSAATPNTNAAAARILDQLGISLVAVERAGCCGAVNHHLDRQGDGLDNMRRNIDAWWPHIEAGAEAIVSTASGCGSMLADYGDLLAMDLAYAAKARRVSELTRDIGQILLPEDLSQLRLNTAIGKVAVHTPCSLQHALKLPLLIADILTNAGFELATTSDDHLCCGSAGTYSILQPAISNRLLNAKMRALSHDKPSIIATGNVGCQLHIASETKIPIVHWVELLDPNFRFGQ
ncbi:MAG: glycolate oxidase subunit GlcF [Halieaceae bacterium]|jgi:glycolate oxidase iron-sulfur subunit|nr:glycolate oxidase subunit GlcF [Halieaceae bacterium]